MLSWEAGANDNHDPCPVAILPGKPASEDSECRFHLGQQAFQEKRYQQASSFWQDVIASNSPLKWVAQGNYAYLLYQGLGREAQKDKAVELFIEAAQHGHLEARAHLGYAYSDKAFSGYDLASAYAWYRSVDLSYEKDWRGEPDKMVLETAKQYLTALKKKMTEEQIRRGEVLAQRMGR